MKKLVLVLAALFAAASVTAEDTSSLTFDAGYNNQYIINGVSRAEGTAYAGFAAVKSLKYADVYVSGVLLPKDGIDQSHWTVGTGKGVKTFEWLTLRLDATATRHQAGGFGIKNSTEFGVKLEAQNPWLTPYVRGAYDINLEQAGVGAGVYHTFGLPFGFKATPSAEFVKFERYDAVTAKLNVSRPIGNFVPYAEVGVIDNNFSTAKYRFATEELTAEVLYSAGVKYTF
jgi:hypothetical protein